MAARSRGWNRTAPSFEDTIVGVQKRSEGHLVLMLRKPTTKSEYGLLLLLPEEFLDTALTAINERIGITLRQVGELDIS